MHSLGVLVSFAVEFNTRNEVSAELANLLNQMKSLNATERPDIDVVIEVCASIGNMKGVLESSM